MGKIANILTAIFVLAVSCKASPLFARSIPMPADSTPAKLIYVVEGEQNYMIPYIERKLKNLRRPDSDTLLYESVASLNILKMTPSIKATAFDILSDTYAGVLEPKLRQSTQQTYSSYLNSYQSFLAIKVTPLQDLVELQFILYDIINDGQDIRYRNSSSIFIDPRSSHYQADVNRGLDQVFEKANKKPRSNLTSNISKAGATYYLTSEDTLLLLPIIDDESSEDDRIYFWTQDSSDKSQAPIEPSKKSQCVKNLKPGIYNLHFRMSNGINYSTWDTVQINVYTKPNLSITRPNDLSFFKKFADRLVIQEYIFSNPKVNYVSGYTVAVDSQYFTLPLPDLWVKIYDKKGTIYVSKSFPFQSGHFDISTVRGSEIINNLDTMESPIKTVKANRYSISFIAKNPAMESRQKTDELNIYQHWPISLLYDVMIFPVDANGLFHSWINAGVGLDLRINKFLSGIAIVGTDLAQASFRHFYTNLIVKFGPYKNFEGGPALLINHDNGNESTGFKISYTFYSGGHTNLKIGGSYYNQDHINYFAIHFTGDIFLNH